ncbi:MAG: hypothetical protein WB801_03615 [Candidatus Dormiibacterota bacterium]
MSEVEVWCTGVYAELDPQRFAPIQTVDEMIPAFALDDPAQ